jgi:hypothetical protein
MAMNRDDIIRMALEAGIDLTKDTLCRYEGWEEPMEMFASIVAAAEREACAKLCDAECNPTPNEGNITTYQSGGYITAEYLASAIRSRGQ